MAEEGRTERRLAVWGPVRWEAQRAGEPAARRQVEPAAERVLLRANGAVARVRGG
jgi:hypothetical protein